MSKHVLFLRNFAQEQNNLYYNSQEIGFCKALVKMGINCDLILYSEGRYEEEVYFKHKNATLTIYKTPAIKILNNSIYTSFINKKKLDKYDIVITTEYNQIMTLFVSLLAKGKVLLYHGPYKDNDRRLIQKLYDIITVPFLKRKLTRIFTKSNLAKSYLENKGFSEIQTLAVGLDAENYSKRKNLKNDYTSKEINEIKKITSTNKVLTYIGKLEERRNIIFLLELFNELLKERKDLKLLIIGDGEENYVTKCQARIEELGISENIIRYRSISNIDLQYFYELSSVFFLPTSYEIFGMVLLESLFFNVPVITTVNGGSQTLIKNGVNGYLINELNLEIWKERTLNVLNNEEQFKIRIKEEFQKDNYKWDKIISDLLGTINERS